MEKYSASFPRYGKLSSTVWKIWGRAPARATCYPEYRTPNPAPGDMILGAEQGGPGYGPQAAAMHWPPHAANAILTPGGPIQTPDVR